MHQSDPIGVFDSGIGGLTVVAEIIRLMPGEDIIYIADSANAPYGARKREFIVRRSLELCQFLIGQGAKALVIACNTATAFAVNIIRERFKLPVIAMEPGIKPAAWASISKAVGILATPGTIASERYINLSRNYAEQVKIISRPCPGLVELIEAGNTDGDETAALLESYIKPLKRHNIDHLVLGCTHYPLVKQQIAAIAGENIKIIDTAPAVARHLRQTLKKERLVHIKQHPGFLQVLSTRINGEANPLDFFDFPSWKTVSIAEFRPNRTTRQKFHRH